MGDTKFTPGPWRVRTDMFATPHVYDKEGTRLTDDFRTGTREGWHSIVHLIAAAPEMYEALANITNGIETGAVRVESDKDVRLENAMRQISAALARARGESND